MKLALAAIVVLGALSAEVIQSYIRRHAAAIHACYEKELRRNPTLRGRITVEWTIESTGLVSNAKVKSSTLENQAVETCVVDRIKRIRFPASDEAGSAIVRMPFDFTPPE